MPVKKLTLVRDTAKVLHIRSQVHAGDRPPTLFVDTTNSFMTGVTKRTATSIGPPP